MSLAAATIRKNKTLILNLWEKTLREENSTIKTTEKLLLLNIMPEILEDIAVILQHTEGKPDNLKPDNYEEVVAESIEHGRHRAAISNFSIKAIIQEHIILHKVLITVLKKEECYTLDTGIVISLILETSISNSAESFDNSLQSMREKLIGTLAHDIRNPLSAASFGLSALEYSYGEEHFNDIKKLALGSVRRSINLVEDLLEAISVKSGEGVSLNFLECDLMDSINLVVWEANKAYSHTFNLECEKETIPGVFAPTSVRRLLENLLTNAVKYGSQEAPVTIAIDDQKDKVVLKVHNHGKPIEPQKMDSIFDFLSGSKDNNTRHLQSWGIGLSYVKMAAEAHGGSVAVESEKQKGTTFTVLLPKHFYKPGKQKALLNFTNSSIPS